MPARPEVSVIIPTRNRAPLLARALDSVFSQEGLGDQFDLEAIVVDDGSTDATAAVVREYAQVRYLRLSTPRGPSAARNAGIKASRGAYICFLDDDDVWLPGRLKLQISVLERHPEAGAVYSQVFHTLTGTAYPQSSRAVSGWIFDTLLSGNLFAVHSVLIRREALERTGYFDETLSTYEDWDLWLRLSFNFPFIFVPGLIAVYLLSHRGLWHTTDEHDKENTGRVIAKALQMLPDLPRYRTARARQALAYGKTWTEILAALRTYPFILRYAWARRWVSLWIRKLALRSESPLTSLRELCTEVRGATSDARRWRVRQTVAKSWAELASSLAVRPAQQQEAAYAAIHAVVLAPSLLVRGALAPIIVRGAIAFCVGSARGSHAA
jgi:glycosyltransferase involved in cell wall biosynthesis